MLQKRPESPLPKVTSPCLGSKQGTGDHFPPYLQLLLLTEEGVLKVSCSAREGVTERAGRLSMLRTQAGTLRLISGQI